MIITEKDRIDEVLTRGVQEILPSKDALSKLIAERQITLYQGFDPSMPSLHLGNLVGLMKLRQFQKLGHKVIFLVGDFTGMIGDPTDKLAARKKLTREEVDENLKLYKDQASKVLSFEGENPAEVKFNSEWNDKLNFNNLIEIASNFTIQQLIERDMFQERLKKKAPIYLHEFLYPVIQGYDSIVMDVDLEIGGSDQLFNMLMGRSLMKAMKTKDKYVLALKLLVDSQGAKVGKTTGNALFLDSTPEAFFAGIMSFPDEVINLGFELLTEVDFMGIEETVKKDPMMEKKKLAFEVVKLLWGETSADSAKEKFEKTFQEKKPEFKDTVVAKNTIAATISQVVGSISEAKRLIYQGAVDVSGNTVNDPTLKVKVGDEIKIGTKIFVKVKE